MTHLVSQLQKALDGRWSHVRQESREDLGAERFAPPSDQLTIEQYRARVAEQVQLLARTGHPARGFAREVGVAMTSVDRSRRLRCSATRTCH